VAKIAEVQEVAVDLLVPYGKNAKKHGKEQIEKLKDSINEFGFLTPCLIDRDFNLIAGHGRVEAAKELGIEKVPCVFIEGLSEEQRRAYILADNRLGELGEWDMGLVQAELAELNALGFDVSLTGFDFDVELDEEAFDENKYTSVVNIPQYEPCGEDVELEDLVDTERYDDLVEEINRSELSEREKEFLRKAAARHLQFSYANIAEYYAKADEEMQRLMEQSALVIIDVDDAIRYGYAQIQSYLDEIEEKEHGEG